MTNLTDETFIDASPTVAYQAIIDEMDGMTNWCRDLGP